MTLVSLFLLTIAGILLIGIFGEVFFARTGVPDVVWLIGVGAVLGPVTGFVDREQLESIAPYFGALTLVVVLFDGGSELKLRDIATAAGRGSTLAVVGFCVCVAALAPASYGVARYVELPIEEWGWAHAIMFGSILGGASAVVIMPALSRANLDARLANLVKLESGLTDVLCVVVTVAAIRFAAGTAASVGDSLAELGRQFGIGLLVGGNVGFVSIFALRRLQRTHFAYPLMLGVLLVLYVLVDELGGSAPLGIITAAVVVGNAQSISKVVGLARRQSLGRDVEGHHDQITFMVKSFFFTFIGAMLGPPWGLVLLGAAAGVVIFLARMIAVRAGTLGAGFDKDERWMITVCMPRGMAAGVLAMLPAQAGVPGTENLPVLVFPAVVTTIMLFAAGFPFAKRRLAGREAAPDAPAAGVPTDVANSGAGI